MMIFTGHTPQGEPRECTYGGPTVEACFSTLNLLVNDGWQLDTANLPESATHAVWLPIKAFDGRSMTKQLQKLERSWQEALIIW
ncbi:hypothetical protein [Spirosoma validum]|uniref:Uncharacterized protein n=1 Tax=Spirosoma validum TaxID=2771355 RepID=A0A927B7Q0_9BACT|nr:hypothetical protein [Spirosoma validum]MBD2756990.1 hypothetical protein [Spirosoma validum]